MDRRPDGPGSGYLCSRSESHRKPDTGSVYMYIFSLHNVFINEFTDLLHAVLRLEGWGCAPSCRFLWGGWGRTGSHLAGEINRPVWTGLQLCGCGFMTRTYRGVMRG